jgi:hypothetical protein
VPSLKASCASDKSDEQTPTDNTNIKARKAIDFQVNFGMFPPTMSLYAITSASNVITLLNRIAIAGYYTQGVTIQHAKEGKQD